MLSHGRSERVSSVQPGLSVRRAAGTAAPPGERYAAERDPAREPGASTGSDSHSVASSSSGPHSDAQPSSLPPTALVSTTPQRRRTSTEPGRMTGPAHTISRLISGSRRKADG